MALYKAVIQAKVGPTSESASLRLRSPDVMQIHQEGQPDPLRWNDRCQNER